MAYEVRPGIRVSSVMSHIGEEVDLAVSKEALTLALLPGLDGTGRLFAPLLDALPGWLEPRVIAYSPVESEPYERLCDRVAESLEGAGPLIVLGESFSGPIAIRLAARLRDLRGVVLAASFARSPVGRWGHLRKPIAALARMRPPRWALRLLLTGARPELAEATRAAIGSVRPEVIAARVEQVLSVDVSAELARCPVRVLYLRGLQDRLVGRRTLRHLKSVRPSLEVVDLDAPHLVLQRRPEEAAAAIAAFAGVCGVG